MFSNYELMIKKIKKNYKIKNYFVLDITKLRAGSGYIIFSGVRIVKAIVSYLEGGKYIILRSQ